MKKVDTYRNPIIHYRGESSFPGPYEVTDEALGRYDVSRERFGSTEVLLETGESFFVKDYQYEVGENRIGMYFLPINDYGVVSRSDGTETWASTEVDTFLRERMNLKPTDPIYAFIYFIHPEQNRGSIAQLADPRHSDKIQMGITHLGSYLGLGKTSNAPPLYHHREWGVDGESDKDYGYPANVMILSLEGVDQATLNQNFHLVDEFLNYGVRFPQEYKNSKFRAVDINTALMFYRDWILERNYLKTDETWFTYCAANKTIVATVALNLPHNPDAFMEVYGAEDGSTFWEAFLKNYYQLTGYDLADTDKTEFEPLWKKQGLTQEQIRPFTLREYRRYDRARRWNYLDRFRGFKPLPPTVGTGWSPQASADIIFDFVDVYADFLDAGAIASCAVVAGFSTIVSDRMGISRYEYFYFALPIMEIIMEADARTVVDRNSPADYHESAYYHKTYEALYKVFGGEVIHMKMHVGRHLEIKKLVHSLEKSAGVMAKDADPESLAWLSLKRVRANWKELVESECESREEAYVWMMESVEAHLEKARDAVVSNPKKIQFNAPPAIAHLMGIGMFPSNPLIKLKTVCTVLEHNELQLMDAGCRNE